MSLEILLLPLCYHCTLESNRGRWSSTATCLHCLVDREICEDSGCLVVLFLFLAWNWTLASYHTAGTQPASHHPVRPQSNMDLMGSMYQKTSHSFLCNFWSLFLNGAQNLYKYWTIVQSVNHRQTVKDQAAMVQGGGGAHLAEQPPPNATSRGSAWRPFPYI